MFRIDLIVCIYFLSSISVATNKEVLSFQNMSENYRSIPSNSASKISQDFDSTFYCENATDVIVGLIIIHLANGSYKQLNVSGPGSFSTSLSCSAVDCSILGQELLINVSKTIAIDQHTSVKATWTGNIIVLDDKEVF